MQRSFSYAALSQTISRTRSHTGKQVLEHLRRLGLRPDKCRAVEDFRRSLGALMHKLKSNGTVAITELYQTLGVSRRTLTRYLALLAGVTLSNGKPLLIVDWHTVVMTNFREAIGAPLDARKAKQNAASRESMRRLRQSKCSANSQETPEEIRSIIQNSPLAGGVNVAVPTGALASSSAGEREKLEPPSSDPPEPQESWFADEPASDRFAEFEKREDETSAEYSERCAALDTAAREPSEKMALADEQEALDRELAAIGFHWGLYRKTRPALHVQRQALENTRRKKGGWQNEAAGFHYTLVQFATGKYQPPRASKFVLGPI